MIKLYYTPPTDAQFEELRQKAIEVWKTYDDTHGYASSKVDRIKDIKNISDNFMFIVAMFDYPNQERLAKLLSLETKKAVSDRIIDGGQSYFWNPFYLISNE